MDFALNEEQEAVRDLARQILGDVATPERHRQLEVADEWIDRKAWEALAGAGLVGIALPVEHGGGGLGFLEAALVLEEIGRTVAKVPYLAAIVLGALPIAEFGDADIRSQWLPRLASGEAIATTALVEPGRAPADPATTARRRGDVWSLSGEKHYVSAGLDADLLLVPAMTGDGVQVFLVDPNSDGVTVVRQDTTTGIPEARVTLSDASALGVLSAGADGAAIVDWITLRATAGLAAMSAGVCDAALHITAEYTKTREQFGRKIATFQAVSQRVGDIYIDTEAIRLTALQAAWRIGQGLPAAREVAIAKYWAAEGGWRVVFAAQHLHGGMGVDRDYPIHRYFLAAKSIELTLGGATEQLLTLGAQLPDAVV
jgi:acyl-CoA dehydrogenase